MRGKLSPFNTKVLQYGADILWITVFSYFLHSRNLCYHHHVNVILHRYCMFVPEKNEEKCNLFWHSVFSVSSRREQKGVTSVKTLPQELQTKEPAGGVVAGKKMHKS